LCIFKFQCTFQGRSHVADYDIQVPEDGLYTDYDGDGLTQYDEHTRSGASVIGNPIGNIQACPVDRDDDDTPLLCPPKQLLPYWPYYLGIFEIILGFLAFGFGKYW